MQRKVTYTEKSDDKIEESGENYSGYTTVIRSQEVQYIYLDEYPENHTNVKYYTDIEKVQRFVSAFVFHLDNGEMHSFLWQSLVKNGEQELDRIIKTMVRNKKESLAIVNYDNADYDDNLIDFIEEQTKMYLAIYQK